jgi:trigger factor
MEINAQKVDQANAKIEAKVSKERVETEENKIAKKIAKDVKIDGFRKGKAPATVVKKLYKDNIEQDSIAQIFQELLKNAVKELGEDQNNLLGEPKVTKYEKNDDGSIDIEFEISFRPKVDTSKVDECIPEIKTPRVTKKEIEQRINELLKAASKIKDVEDDRELKEGDIAVIDFEGFVDGKAFEGGKAEDYALEIGSGSFIPGFEDALIGMKKGETKEINVTFPKEYGSADLAGKDAMFKVTLKKIQERVLPDISDEELLKRFLPDIEHPTQEDLEKSIKKQIKREKLNKLYLDELKPKFTEALIEKIDFDLPKTVVDQEIDISFRNSLQNKSEEEIKELQENPDKVEELRKEFEDEAKESVKLTFIVDELAKEKDIKVDDNEVVQAIYYEAMQQGQDPKKYLEYYQKQGLLPAIKMAMVEDKLFSNLLKLDEQEK